MPGLYGTILHKRSWVKPNKMDSLLKNKLISVAPMMDWSDRHCRYFMRLLNQTITLYTEMVTTGAILHGDPKRLLRYSKDEQPLVVQLGGSCPEALRQSARICEDAGFGAINLNVGCPSDRVQRGMIGACLMAHPNVVADCIEAMGKEVSVPVTVKTRIGIDHQDSYEFLYDFVNQVGAAGCKTFIVHARIAWLEGLSPRENRDIPPLIYERVYQLKRDFPELTIIINGGITTVPQITDHCQHVDGVMIGRAAYKDPQILREITHITSPSQSSQSLHEVLAHYAEYCRRELSEGVYLSCLTRHILGLFQGLPGARAWRRYLSENAHRSGAGIEVITEAAKRVLVP